MADATSDKQSPPPTQASPSRARRRRRLVDLVDVELLQRVQDWFSYTHKLGVVIRDPEGKLVTRPSNISTFCRTMLENEKACAFCLASHREAMKTVASATEPVLYTCHAGLAQVASPIVVEGAIYGYIIAGMVVDQPLEEQRLRELAHELDMDPEALVQAGKELVPWSSEHVRESIRMLSEITSAITKLCLHGLQLQETVDELCQLHQLSVAITSSFELSEILDTVTRRVVEIFDVKASIVRLFDEETGQSIITASYGLSKEYLEKGPLRISQESTRLTRASEPIYIEDLAHDPRVIYRESAIREGLRSSLGIALRVKGRAIGTLRIYSAERRKFEEREIRLFSSIANQVALAIENARLVDNLRRTNVALREAYTTLKSTQQRLLESERLALVGRLAAGIVHEVGNPQASVYGIATTIRDHFDELSKEQILNMLEMIREASQRTTHIVNEIRSYARRPEDGWHDSELARIVDEVVAMARFDKTFSHVDIHVEKNAQPVARIQPERIRQVLINLLRNAAEAVQRERGNIWVIVDERDGKAVVSVKDDGVGIPENLLERIWEPFFTTKGDRGTGLGLDICRQIVQAHGGRITVRSQVGEGSTFTVELPLAPSERASPRPRGAARETE